MKLFGSSKNEIPFRLGKEFKVPIDEKGYHHFFIERAKKDKHILIKGIGIRDTVDNAINPNYSEDEFRQHCQESFNLLKEHLGKYLPDTMLVYGKDKDSLYQGSQGRDVHFRSCLRRKAETRCYAYRR